MISLPTNVTANNGFLINLDACVEKPHDICCALSVKSGGFELLTITYHFPWPLYQRREHCSSTQIMNIENGVINKCWQ